MSPHILNSLKTLRINNFVSTRSAHYKLSHVNENDHQINDDPYNSLIGARNTSRLTATNLSIQTNRQIPFKHNSSSSTATYQKLIMATKKCQDLVQNRPEDLDQIEEVELNPPTTTTRVDGDDIKSSDSQFPATTTNEMPLLGRHRREHQQQQQQQHQATGNANQSSEPVCQSPMFGVRRQINLNKCCVVPNVDQSISSSPSTSSRQQQLQQSRSSPSLNNNRQATVQSTTTSADKVQQQELPQQISRQQIHYAFALMDSNGDGMIDLRDLSQMLANLGVPIDESVLSYIITTSVSRRGDHRISENEFLDWLGQFVRVTAGSDEQTSASAATITRASAAGNDTQAKKYRSGRARFRLVGGSSGSSLVAKSTTDVPENFGPSGRRRGSVGSGLALMRSLSGSSLQQQQEQASSVEQSSSSSTLTGSSASASSAGSGLTQQQIHQKELDEQEIRQDLRAAFCVFDLDGDGFITFDEVRAGLRLLGEAWTTAEMSRLFNSGRLQQPVASTTTISGRQTTATTNNSTLMSPNDLSRQRISIDDFVRLLL